METESRPVPLPTRRRLRVYGFDPSTSRVSGQTLTLSVPMEPLTPGPVGSLLRVCDQLGTGQWLIPVDLDDVAIVHQDGITPSESDPRSHQQIVYAVASAVIERFETFLGRRFRWKAKDKLTLIPHAFEGTNAMFDPHRQRILFGYYRAPAESVDSVLPEQMIYTCLSFDIIAHEVTHALVHRLRQYFIEPTNPDVLACHEAFADLVTLFHRFVFDEIVADALANSRGDLAEAKGLLSIALEFGQTTGRGGALRRALSPPDAEPQSGLGYAAPRPHDRGAVFVASFFEAFVQSYRSRIADLLRIATGGTGVLPEGHLPPDLVTRLTSEATKLADRYLAMAIRSFDYFPVVDPTFGDLVRAIITADRDLYPQDGGGLRRTLIQSFRSRGIYPEDAASLDEDALVLRPAPQGMRFGISIEEPLAALLSETAQDLGSSRFARPSAGAHSKLAGSLKRWAERHRKTLGFGTQREGFGKINLVGRHISFRQAEDHQPQPEVVVQFTQTFSHPEAPEGFLRSGATVIADPGGQIKYIISKPLTPERIQLMLQHLNDDGHTDPNLWSETAPVFERLHLSIEDDDGPLDLPSETAR